MEAVLTQVEDCDAETRITEVEVVGIIDARVTVFVPQIFPKDLPHARS